VGAYFGRDNKCHENLLSLPKVLPPALNDLGKRPQAPQLRVIRTTSIAEDYKLVALITHICSTCERLQGEDCSTFLFRMGLRVQI